MRIGRHRQWPAAPRHCRARSAARYPPGRHHHVAGLARGSDSANGGNDGRLPARSRPSPKPAGTPAAAVTISPLPKATAAHRPCSWVDERAGLRACAVQRIGGAGCGTGRRSNATSGKMPSVSRGLVAWLDHPGGSGSSPQRAGHGGCRWRQDPRPRRGPVRLPPLPRAAGVGATCALIRTCGWRGLNDPTPRGCRIDSRRNLPDQTHPLAQYRGRGNRHDGVRTFSSSSRRAHASTSASAAGSAPGRGRPCAAGGTPVCSLFFNCALRRLRSSA